MLAVRDMDETIAFYQTVLGFTTIRSSPDYAIVARDKQTIHLQRTASEHVLNCVRGHTEIYLEVTAVRTLWEHARTFQHRYRIRPLSDREYGMTEFHIEDPNGCLVFVGEQTSKREEANSEPAELLPALPTLRPAAYAETVLGRSEPQGRRLNVQDGFPLVLPRFSIGVGDRFAQEAAAQLDACILALRAGVVVAPVWNKSNREHTIIGSEPAETRAAADAAVRERGWENPYFVDADHINLKTVDRFLEPSNFFTLDVADLIGQPASTASVDAFVSRHPELLGEVRIPGIDAPFRTDEALLRRVANTFLAAVEDAGTIYRSILDRKGEGRFVPEVSMDETERPQTPVELLIILAAIADQHIPIQTIAPKFTGRFNKGVDYVGDVRQFAREFNEDLAAIAFAVATYGLPANLKLSVHSGSDKFSIYAPIHEAITRTGAGVHLKTAGTTWLEELIGLAEAGWDGLAIAKEVYREAFAHAADLTKPYATVIDINEAQLPSPDLVDAWSSDQYTRALRHNSADPAYNPSFRQLLHVGFKVAAKLGDRYLEALDKHQEVVARNVTTNLFERHIRPVFLGK